MALDLAQMRAMINASKNKTTSYDSSSVFSFKKLNVGDQIRIRFIDDGEQNDFFWRTLCTRSLSFDSIRLANGSIVQNKTYVSVPAFNIKKGDVNISNLPENYIYYSNDDVINQKIKPLWDGTEEGSKLYNKFRRTERYVFQGFVRSEGYETKLYRFIINKDLFNVIYSFLSDDEILHTPSDPINGRDFILKVTEKTANINGQPQKIKDYSTSKWSSMETPLSDDEKAWLQTNSPFVLKTFIPERPTLEQERIMLNMYEDSYNGEPYDYVKYNRMFKPDNVFFDDQGNIKDMKGGKASENVSTEIPQATVQQMNNFRMNAFQMNMNQQPMQMQQPVQQPMYQNQPVQQFAQPMQMQQPVQQPAQQMTAPQLIAQNSETISGQNSADLIKDIMSKFNINQ